MKNLNLEKEIIIYQGSQFLPPHYCFLSTWSLHNKKITQKMKLQLSIWNSYKCSYKNSNLRSTYIFLLISLIWGTPPKWCSRGSKTPSDIQLTWPTGWKLGHEDVVLCLGPAVLELSWQSLWTSRASSKGVGCLGAISSDMWDYMVLGFSLSFWYMRSMCPNHWIISLVLLFL